MSTGQRITGEWYLDRANFKDHYQRVTLGTSTKLQRARQYMVMISMQGFGLSSWNPANRQKRNSFSLRSGPETRLGFVWTGRTFLCTDDTVDTVDTKTGEFTRSQVWEHYTKWEDVPDSEFESMGGGG